MLTAFILATSDDRALARTLNALIEAAVEGLVREVVVIARADDQRAAMLADQGGCALATEADFPSLIASAKAEWVLILKAGSVPEPGWGEALEAALSASKQPDAFHFTRSPLSPRPWIARILARESPLALGLIARKRLLVAGDGPVMDRAAALRCQRFAGLLRAPV
jgi:hypothetical protein